MVGGWDFFCVCSAAHTPSNGATDAADPMCGVLIPANRAVDALDLQGLVLIPADWAVDASGLVCDVLIPADWAVDTLNLQRLVLIPPDWAVDAAGLVCDVLVPVVWQQWQTEEPQRPRSKFEIRPHTSKCIVGRGGVKCGGWVGFLLRV